VTRPFALEITVGFRVQGFAWDDGESEETDDVFVGVTCLEGGSAHLVNPKTGKMAGERRKQRIASPLSGRAAGGPLCPSGPLGITHS
jgi:hypothetical protein